MTKGEEIVGAWEENYPPARVVHWYRRIRHDLARRIDEALEGEMQACRATHDMHRERARAAEARLAIAERLAEAARELLGEVEHLRRLGSFSAKLSIRMGMLDSLAAWDAK